jgi:hypothetical protein
LRIVDRLAIAKAQSLSYASTGQARNPAPERPVVAVFELLKMTPHRVRAPRTISSQLGDGVPVRVGRRHQDYGVVGRAAAERRGARIEDAAPPPGVDAGTALGVVAEVVDAGTS